MAREFREEILWQQTQPVLGNPSITRLRVGLKAAGLPVLRITIDADRELLQCWLARRDEVRGLDREQTTRRLITVLRAAGFEVGFVELVVPDSDFHPTTLYGSTLVGPLEEICEFGPPEVES